MWVQNKPHLVFFYHETQVEVHGILLGAICPLGAMTFQWTKFRVLDHKHNQSKLDKHLCFSIWNHGNYDKLL